ncbi:DUF3050 domain-containing protein [Paraflavitalea pollutisoli]|uniref:DUF3050 domain-containing protein n=1 Tax=Paraflavitalea pollutisoli TaxID=3034143 RepID=UPI0023EB47C1|nr:DUF3050 domain-containing protein [Paraflavitalea sp. H1-2-19X]
MSKYIDRLQRDIEPLRQQLIQHPVYAATNNVDRLRIFLEHHVFAVWDFMSLLKSLQRNLTSVELPWIPVGSPETRYLINEIVLGEESDVDQEGRRTSHFELYLKAMAEAGCRLAVIDGFIDKLKGRQPVTASLQNSGVPQAAARFVEGTFAVIHANQPATQAAVFTFGREDLIPGMFISFVTELNKQTGNQFKTLKYYLERHIEVDGEHHSQLAFQMTEELHGEDEQMWQTSTEAVKLALQQRIELWDAIAQSYK